MPRIYIAIFALGIAALIGKLADLLDWHLNRRPIMDTQTNGGVSTVNGSHARVTAR